MTSPRLAWCIACWLTWPLCGQAQVPGLIRFQGQVSKDKHPFNGQGEFKFSFVNSNGTITFWSNDGTGLAGAEPSNAISGPVDEGVFSIILGDSANTNMTPISPTIFTNASVNLRIWFREAKHDKKRVFELLVPDQRIAAVGYAMFAANVAQGSITAAHLAANAVTTASLALGAVGTAQLADGAVTRDKLAPGAVPALPIADAAITTSKLADQAVTTAKLSDQTVTAAKLAMGSVTTSNLMDQVVITTKLGDEAVTTPKLAVGAVTSTKLATGAVQTGHLLDAAVTRDKLAAASVGPAQLGMGAVESNALAPGAALANLLASGLGGVPSGGIVISSNANDATVTSAGYVSAGAFDVMPERWETRTAVGCCWYAAAWTGRELITYPGGRYDPATDTWRPASSVGAPSVRSYPAAVWTGTELIVWSGRGVNNTYLQDGARYNPATDAWTPMTTLNAPGGRIYTPAIWTGTEMLVWGGRDASGTSFSDGGAYSPSRDAWRPLSAVGAPARRFDHTAVWTGTEMIVWGGVSNYYGASTEVYFSTGARYRPANDSWAALPTNGAPPAVSQQAAVWTGSEMIVWGGRNNNYGGRRNGARYNPSTDSWRQVSLLGAPLGTEQHSAVWTGSEMIIWGGTDNESNIGATDAGARYNPVCDCWAYLSRASAPPPHYEHRAVWNGEGMFIVGGRESQNATYDVLYFWKPPVTGYLYQKR